MMTTSTSKVKLIMSIVAPILLLLAVASLVVLAWYVSMIQTGDLDATTKNLVVEYAFNNSNKSNVTSYNVNDVAFFDKNEEKELGYISDMAIRLQIKLKNNSDNKIDYTVEFYSKKNITYRKITSTEFDNQNTYYVNYGKARGSYSNSYFTKSNSVGYLDTEVTESMYYEYLESSTYYVNENDNYVKATGKYSNTTTYYIKTNDEYDEVNSLSSSTYYSTTTSTKYYEGSESKVASTGEYSSSKTYYVKSYYAKATPAENAYYATITSDTYYVDNDSVKSLATGKYNESTEYYTKSNDVYTLASDLDEASYYETMESSTYYKYNEEEKYVSTDATYKEYEDYYTVTSIAYVDCIVGDPLIEGEKYTKIDVTSEGFRPSKTTYYKGNEHALVEEDATFDPNATYYIKETVLVPRNSDETINNLQFNSSSVTYNNTDFLVDVFKEGELNIDPEKASYEGEEENPVDESYIVFNLYIFGVQEIPSAKNDDFIYSIENDERVFRTYNFKLIFTASPIGDVEVNENTSTSTPVTSTTTTTTTETTTTTNE